MILYRSPSYQTRGHMILYRSPSYQTRGLYDTVSLT